MKRLGDPPYICLITEGKANPQNYIFEKTRILKTIREAVSDGVTLVQIREKSLPARLLVELAAEVVSIAASRDVFVSINGRADIALAAGAGGVHLPEDAVPPRAVRRAFPTLEIGVSTHTLENAKAAAENGADYIFFGPVFETPGKAPPAGIELLAEVCKNSGDLPVIALGGIDQSNYIPVIRAGAAGIAAIRALNDTRNRRQIIDGLTTGDIR